jgi:sugar transferase EpsL
LKRTFDIVVSTIILGVFFPIMLCIALLIRIKIGSPVLFKQLRPGWKSVPFYLYKFRTMSDLRDENGNLLPDKDRSLPLGKILRMFSLDELPQLINVIRGQISLVGPRPLLMEYLPLYTEEQARRHDVRPGITGWAQVNGRNAISWEEKFKLDIWYIEHQSLGLDIKILWLTVYNVFRPKGAVIQGNIPMEKFKGSSIHK